MPCILDLGNPALRPRPPPSVEGLTVDFQGLQGLHGTVQGLQGLVGSSVFCFSLSRGC